MSSHLKLDPGLTWEDGWIQIFETLADHFPKSKPTGLLPDRYAEMLVDIPLPVLTAAAMQCVASSRWFPTIAELRDAAAMLTEPERRSGLEVWGESIEEMSRAKADGRPPRYADPLAARLLKAMGGHAALASSKDPSYDRTQFCKAYEAARERERQQARILPQARALLASAEQPSIDVTARPVERPRLAAMAAPAIELRCEACGKTETIKPSQYRSGLLSECCGAPAQVGR